MVSHYVIVPIKCISQRQMSCYPVPFNGYKGRSGDSGPRLNIKTVLSRYGDSYVKDKTAVRTSYL